MNAVRVSTGDSVRKFDRSRAGPHPGEIIGERVSVRGARKTSVESGHSAPR